MKTDKYVCNLSKDVVAVATEELGEKPERREADIEAVREWLKENSYINADSSAKSILSFLRVSKFCLEQTKKRIELYYTVKTASPEFFTELNPFNPTIQHCLNAGIVLPLEGKDNLGRRVLLCRPGALDPTEVKDIYDAMKYVIIIYAVIMDEWEDIAINGLVIVQDNENYSAAFLVHLTPTLLKKAFRIWDDCLPIFIKGWHNVNTAGVFTIMWKLMMPFMNANIRNTAHLHEDNFDSLYDHVPREILPKDYGGNTTTLQELTDTWKKKVESRREWFLEQEKFKSEESKRPGPKRDLEKELFGIASFFRKLDID